MTIWSDNAASFRSLARQLREQAARETDRDAIARLLDHAAWYDERAQIHQECHDAMMDEDEDA